MKSPNGMEYEEKEEIDTEKELLGQTPLAYHVPLLRNLTQDNTMKYFSNGPQNRQGLGKEPGAVTLGKRSIVQGLPPYPLCTEGPYQRKKAG